MFRYTNQFHFARPALSALVALATCVALLAAPLAGAQAPAASGNTAPAPSPEELEKLVGPIALYPDDLVALILPASTNPLQLVQAARFLEKRKKDSKLQIDAQWDDSVKSLVNYPEIVKKMSDDLDWTADLGEAVVANQGAVLDAVQGFRRKAQSAGNLKSDPKQSVVVEQEVIKIVPSDPQVIYVPQYNPTTVVAYSSVPVYGYYPAPYPSYYYPYAPGAALATGLIWGAAIGAAWNGGRYGTNWSGGNNNITVNRNTNINTSNINASNVNRSRTQAGQSTAWRSDKRPGQVSSGSGRGTGSGRYSGRTGDAAGGARGSTQRAGDFAGATPRAGDAAGGARGGTQGGAEGAGGARGSTQRGAEGAGAARGSTQRGAEGAGAARGSTQRGAEGAGGARGSAERGGGMQGSASSRSGASSRDAVGGYGSGNAARADSSRGAASRSSMSSHGGARAGGGGRRGR